METQLTEEQDRHKAAMLEIQTWMLQQTGKEAVAAPAASAGETQPDVQTIRRVTAAQEEAAAAAADTQRIREHMMRIRL